jgi:hypothetical protein
LAIKVVQSTSDISTATAVGGGALVVGAAFGSGRAVINAVLRAARLAQNGDIGDVCRNGYEGSLKIAMQLGPGLQPPYRHSRIRRVSSSSQRIREFTTVRLQSSTIMRSRRRYLSSG